MGSSFSILNDTKHNVWITHGINWEFLTVFVQGASISLSTVMAIAGASAGKTSTKVAGMTATQWTKAEKITNLTGAALSESLRKAGEEAKKVQDDVKRFKAHAELKKPGEKYTFPGTLSLSMTVYVMNDKQQVDTRACFTGPTHDSENIYPISQYFTNLDVT